MSEPLRNALLFLITTLFDLYLFVLIIRLVLVWIHSDYFNPLVQFVIKVTDFLIKPTRRVIPNIGRIEIATVFWIIVFEIVKYCLLGILNLGMLNIIGVLLLSVGDFIRLIVQTFFYAIIAQSIISWIQPHSPVGYTLYQFTSPLMRPIQRFVPSIGNIDLSPIPALILLQLILIMVAGPVMAIGWSLMSG